MDAIEDDRFYQQPDVGILVNLGFCLVVSLPLFAAFCFLRRRIYRIFDANLNHRNRTEIPNLKNGSLSWIVTVFKLEDKYLLLLLGLDGFVFLKSLKLMMIVMVFFALLSMTTIWPTYYFSSSSSSNYYIRSCIRNIRNSNLLWVPFFVVVASTLFVLYAIYMFYRNYVVYRQAYMKSPNTFQALNKVETYSARLRSYNLCLGFFDVVNRSILVSGISSTYSTDRLYAILGDAGLGDIQSIFIVKDRTLIMQRLRRLNDIHEKLEKLYLKFFNLLLKAVQKDYPEIQETLEKMSEELMSNAEIRDLLHLVNSRTFFPEHREDCTTKLKEKVDAISHYSTKLLAAQEEMDDLIYHYIHDSDSAVTSPLPYSEHIVEDPESFDSHVELISGRGLFRVLTNVNDFKLTLWGSSASAIVIFKDWKSANIASQTLLSCRPFSMDVEPAPMVTEVDWDNLNMPRADRSLRNLLGTLLYVIINVFFSIFVAMFASLLDMEVLESVIPFLKPILKDFPKIRELIMGILGPLSLNIIFALIPYLLVVLTYYQAYVNKTDAQLNIMNKYSLLLLLQTFIVALAGPVHEIFKAVYKQDYSSLLGKLDKKAAYTSAIFLNLTLQKAFIGLIIVITKPMDILFAFFARIFTRHMTPRSKQEINKPTSLPLGFLYPEYAVIIFQMCMSFGFITPLIFFAGTLFFSLALFIFRAQFIYSDKIPHETGGQFWPSMATHIMSAMLMAQFFTLIQFVSLKGRFEAVFLLPVILFTIFAMVSMREKFSRRGLYMALSGEFKEASLRLIKEQQDLREEVIDRNYTEPNNSSQLGLEVTGDPDVQRTVRTFDSFNTRLEIEENAPQNTAEVEDEIISGMTQLELTNNPYINPVILKRLRTLMLPLNFFALIKWARDNPPKPPTETAQ